MHYKFEVNTPSETQSSDPKETTINLVSGVVDQVTIEFPAGCAGLVGARISQGLFQLWPLTANEWFVTDNFTIVFPEHYQLTAGANQLRIETYNEDDTYDHTLNFSFSISALAPDPMRQIAEIIAKREPVSPKVLYGQLAATGALLEEIQNILYVIHGQDFPMLAQYLEQLGAQ